MGLKWSATILAIVGVACLVFGILFIIQAGDSQQKVADEIAPLEISEVNATYDQLSAAYSAVRGTGTAEESAYLLQKTSVGLAKSNLSTIKFVRNSGILDIVLGAGLVLASAGLFRQD